MTIRRPADGAGAMPSWDPTPVLFVQMVDAQRVEWTVVEVDAADVPGARGQRCLLFTRADCIRRVWRYPPDWRTLGAEQLVALSWQR